MGHSQRLRLSEVRSVFHVVGEVRELGADTPTWRRHMLTRLNGMLGSQASVAHELAQANAPGRVDGSVGFDGVVWDTDEARRTHHERVFGPQQTYRESTVRYVRLLGPRSVTRSRAQLLGDAEYRRSDEFNEGRRPFGLDDFIYAGYVLPAAGCVHGFSLHRPAGDRPFGMREVRLVDLLHEELARLWQAPPPSPTEVASLPPRLKQVGEMFRRGDSEKRIAYLLGLSKHSVHAYAKELHKRFDVSSRGELIAALAPPPPTFRPRLSVEAG